MASLLDKIEADAAKRLILPPERKPAEELARYKNFLKFENHRLHLLHRAGGGGREVCRARATVLDVLLRYLLQAVEKNLAANEQKPKFALIAIGGYGRGELNPFSDIDIMFLHESDLVRRGKANPFLSAITDGLLYTLWDVGLKVGHSVRSIEDCVKIANTDMQSKTSLIEARVVAGDEGLFQQMHDVVVAKCIRGFEDAYIEARIQDQNARREKFGNSASMQEPNIKNGSGALRDYQNLLWMAYVKYRVQSLEQLEERSLISETERKQLDSAYDFLLWARTDLHYLAKRAVDVLPKNLQPAIAHDFGYTDRSPSVRLEKFMRDLYNHMRNIYLITRTLEQRLALLRQPTRLPSLKDLLQRGRRRAVQQVIDGFKIIDKEIYAGSARVFKDQPRRLMRVFLHAQHRGCVLHPDLAQMIRNELSLVGREFLKDTHVHETFLEILNQRGNVAPILRAMHETGLLGKYLPEFGKLTCLVQHEFYHQYTADEHTLRCIEKLDQIWEAKEPPFSNYSNLLQGLERPFVLYLALLLHDAGKAQSGKHAEVGGQLANNVARRLNLDGATTHSLRLIIESHLSMLQISQRRDLDDKAVVQSFAAQIQTPENLVMLTLHSFADSQGTSDKLWNGFKDSLLWDLYGKTNSALNGGTDFLRAEERQMELLTDEVRGLLPHTFSPEEIKAHFENLPPRYFHLHSAKQIGSDISLAHRFMHLQLAEEDKALEPVLTWHNEPDRGYTSVHICTWDRTGLFSKIAGSLTAAGLNILSAQIFTRRDGIILDTFFVSDARTGLLANREEREKFEHYLKDALTGELDLGTLIRKQKPITLPYKSLDGDPIPTVINFDNGISERWSVIDIETEDQIGLLYAISETLAELDLDIALAKIVTEKGAAIDSFYVRDRESKKIIDPERQKEVDLALGQAIEKLSRAR